MSVGPTIVRSRRALLGAGIAALGAAVAHALGRPLGVRAADGDPVLAGADNTSSQRTRIVNSGSGDALQGIAEATANDGLYGRAANATGSGVYGEHGSSGYGVRARSAAGTALRAEALGFGYGVHATSATGEAIYGYSLTSSAVHGAGRDGTGVQGFSTHGIGVSGQSSTGNAIHGYAESPEKPAVVAWAPNNTALLAHAGAGALPTSPLETAVFAHAGPGATALRAKGPVSFSSAGLATIPSGSDRVTVTPGIDVTAGSKILCTLQGSAGGTTTVLRVSRDTTNDRFTIYLTRAATAATPVAWFLIS